MQILTGSKRETTTFEWLEIIEKYYSRLSASLECLRRYKEISDCEHVAEDAREIAAKAEKFAEVIQCMNDNDIK